MKKEPLIEVKGLNYRYPTGEIALKDLTVKIYDHERLVILGSNGAGKSTFFLNLNGVLIPDQGSVFFKGKKIGFTKKELRMLREHIGIVFQNADNQIIASTVEGEVSFGPMNMGLTHKEVEKRVETALAEMNLLKFRDRAPHYLSGGEKKRVTIADIIAMHPDVFIFDEPTAALDPLGAEMLEETLSLLAKAHKTVIVSTHLVDFAWRWADRIIVFDNGSVVGEGDPLEIFRNETVLKQANLKKPVLISITEDLIEYGILPDSVKFPRDTHEFKALLKKYYRNNE